MKAFLLRIRVDTTRGNGLLYASIYLTVLQSRTFRIIQTLCYSCYALTVMKTPFDVYESTTRNKLYRRKLLNSYRLCGFVLLRLGGLSN